jgi:SH3 domain protein
MNCFSSRLTLACILLGFLAPVAFSAEEKPADTEESEATNIDTIYVTDTLHLKLYEEAGGKGATLRTLSSGNALKLLETKGRYQKVETVDGIVGWVKKFYTVSKPPASVALPEIQKLLEERDIEVERLKQELKEKAVGSGLREDYEEKMIQLNEENVRLTNEKEQLRKQLDQAQLKLLHAEQSGDDSAETPETQTIHPALIAAITAIAGILLGTVLGYRLYSNRLKKRFYGYKM